MAGKGKSVRNRKKGVKVTAAEAEEKKRLEEEKMRLEEEEEEEEKWKKERLAEEEEKKTIEVMVMVLMKKKSLEMPAEEVKKRDRMDRKHPTGMTGPELPPSLWPEKEILELRGQCWRYLSVESLAKLLSGKVQNDSEICKTLQDYRDEYRSKFVADVDLSQLRELKSTVYPGCFVGNIAIKRRGFPYAKECSNTHPSPIGYEVTTLEILADDDSLFILVVPDSFILDQLAIALVHVRFRCIIIAASDMSSQRPDLRTRIFLKYLHVYLKLPVLALGHCDLNWLEALSVYVQGMPRDSVALAIPDIKWVGLRPRNLHTDGASGKYVKSMLTNSSSEARDMLRSKTFCNQVLRRELDYMYKTVGNVMANLRALATTGGSMCLSEIYLPIKLQNKDWLDLKTGAIGS